MNAFLPSLPSGDKGPKPCSPVPPCDLDALTCNLCGEPMAPHEFSQAVRDATNMDICCACLERHAENDCATH